MVRWISVPQAVGSVFDEFGNEDWCFVVLSYTQVLYLLFYEVKAPRSRDHSPFAAQSGIERGDLIIEGNPPLRLVAFAIPMDRIHHIKRPGLNFTLCIRHLL